MGGGPVSQALLIRGVRCLSTIRFTALARVAATSTFYVGHGGFFYALARREYPPKNPKEVEST